jgi:hypothetical protein
MNDGARPKKSLQEFLITLDVIQARRFSKLKDVHRGMATEGIIRHLRACKKAEMQPDINAVREIIDDAITERNVFGTVDDDVNPL